MPIDDIWVSIASGLAGGTLGGTLLGPWLEQKFQIKGIYRIPYHKWCLRSYGYVHELGELCYWIRNKQYKIIDNDFYIIYHLWGMHRQAEEVYKWLGKMEKDENRLARKIKNFRKENPPGPPKNASDAFNDLMDGVDGLWPQLETTYPQIRGYKGKRQFKKLLDKMPIPDRKVICKVIIDEIETGRNSAGNEIYSKAVFDRITTYFKENIR